MFSRMIKMINKSITKKYGTDFLHFLTGKINPSLPQNFGFWPFEKILRSLIFSFGFQTQLLLPMLVIYLSLNTKDAISDIIDRGYHMKLRNRSRIYRAWSANYVGPVGTQTISPPPPFFPRKKHYKHKQL